MLPYSDSTNAYLYLKTDFISASTISLTCLDIEIQATDLTKEYVFALTEENEDSILFMFTRPLSIPEQLTLTGIVEAHTGICPIPDTVAKTEVIDANPNEVLTYDSTSGLWINQLVDHDHVTNLDHDTHTQYVPINATRGMSADWDAGNVNIRADGGFATGETDVELASFANITGLLTGGGISINESDPTLLDIAAGTGIHVDMTDRSAPHVHTISWDAQTIDPELEGYRSKWIGIRSINYDATAVVETSFTAEEKRNIIILGRFWGNGTATITTAKNYADGAFSFGKSMEDIASTIGSVNEYGNNYEASTVGLKLKRTSGRSFRFAANYDNNEISPNIYDSPESDPQNSYSYHLRNSTTTISKTQIDPNYYDVDGTAVLVATGQWTTQQIYYFPVSNTTHVVYGQNIYASKSLAYDGIIRNNLVLNNDILDGSILRAYLLLKQGCTDLSNTNECEIVKAYSDPGLVPGFTNHGELGGLEDDDHPQYHNDTRGDARYYQKAYIEQSENILYTYPPLTAPSYPFDVKTALDNNYHWQSDIGFSGRITPEVALSLDSTNINNIVAAAGSGYISDGDQTVKINWNEYIIENAGYYTQGNWFVNVDINGNIYVQDTINESFSNIRLGSFFSFGNGLISSIIQCPCYINSAGNRIVKILFHMGPFIHDESGQLQVSSNNDLALTVLQTNVHWALDEFHLEELDTVDDIDVSVIRNNFKSSNGVWSPDYWFSNPNGGNGKFPIDRYNDITADGSSLVVASFTFTNGSKTITVSGDYTGSIDKDDFIYLRADSSTHMAPIEDSTGSVVFSGGATTITLEENYTGTGGTGNAIVIKSLPRIPSGKYVKHIVFRALDGGLISAYGNELFDTEDDAKKGALPDYPASVKVPNVWIAYLIANSSLTSWEGQIYDLRPLPFFREGFVGGAGGGSVITSHSGLSDLDADDHLQYLRTDGSRDLTGPQKYAFQPIFTNDKSLITKKYVDDMFPVDHEDLLNKGSNTHVQIDTHIADTSIHFTEASIDHNAITNTHNLTTDIDHDLLTNTHNLTTDIDHNTITNTHNLTTDIDHNQLTNYDPDRHFLWTDVTAYVEINTITDAEGVWNAVGLGYASSDAISSTTSTTYQNKVSITTPAEAGTYRIGYSMEFNAQQNNKDVQVRLYNSTNAVEPAQNSQQTNNNKNWFSFTGFYYITIATATATTFILQYKAGTATCQVRNAQLELWRVL